MSVLTRIRLVGTVATSIALALGLFTMFWLMSFFDTLPGIQTAWLGAVLTGLPLLATLCLLLALPIDPSQRRVQSTSDPDLMPQEGGTFEAPLEVGQV
jgi:hypothetical protein